MSSGFAIEVTIPALGVAMTEATIVCWLVEVGDEVTQGQPLLEIETDKVVAPVESPVSGVVHELLADPDEIVEVGAVVALIAGGERTEPSVKPSEQQQSLAPPSPKTVIVDQLPAQQTDQPVDVLTPAQLEHRQPHRIPPRVRFNERTGIRPVTADRTTATPATGSTRDWVLAFEVPADGALGRLDAARRSGELATTFTDVIISAVARGMAETSPEQEHTIQLGVATDVGLVTTAIPGAHALLLGELAEVRSRSVDFAWAGVPVSALAGTLTVTVVNFGKGGPWECLPPMAEGTAISIGVGSVTERVVVLNEGFARKRMMRFSIRADADAVHPARLKSFVESLKERIVQR